jgi:hypothetical protein
MMATKAIFPRLRMALEASDRAKRMRLLGCGALVSSDDAAGDS